MKTRVVSQDMLERETVAVPTISTVSRDLDRRSRPSARDPVVALCGFHRVIYIVPWQSD